MTSASSESARWPRAVIAGVVGLGLALAGGLVYAIIYTSQKPNPQVRYLQAIELLKRQQLDAAHDELAQLLITSPDFAPAYLALSRILIAQKDYESAITQCDQALKLGIDRPGVAWLNRATAHRELQQWDAMLQDAQNAAKHDPSNASVYTAQAQALLQLGKPQDALDVLETALSKSPRHALARFLQVQIMAQQDKTQEALEKLNQLINTDGPSPTYVLYRARLYNLLDKPEKAIDDFTWYLVRFPDDEKILAKRFMAYNRTGQADKAREDLNQMMRLRKQSLVLNDPSIKTALPRNSNHTESWFDWK